MRKILFFSLLIAILRFNFVFAQMYNISQISNVKLVTSYSVDTTIDQMDTVTFGSYPQSDASGATKEPIEWIVLDRQGDKYLLLSKYILDCKCYNDTGYIAWENSTLRNWLNETFLNDAFNSSEQTCIETTNVIVSDAKGTSGNKYSNDKIFCLSIDDVKKYFNYKWGDSRWGWFEGKEVNNLLIEQYFEESKNKKLATYGTNYLEV